MKMKMDNNCKYLEVQPWYGEVFDHPEYRCYCTLINKELPFGIIHCHKCVNYSQKEASTNEDCRG